MQASNEQMQRVPQLNDPAERPGPTNCCVQLSVVTPAYNEAENLPLLYSRLSETLNSLRLDWEWIVVDDHSADNTFAVVEETASKDARVRGFRFARNCGSHAATMCGLDHVRGDCAVVMASDLQDPPEVLPDLVKQWRAGSQTVWAARQDRVGEKKSTILFSRLYYFMMRNAVGIKELPARGADFFLIDRRVIDAFRDFGENNMSIVALIASMGFRQATITYNKQARAHGRSGWTLAKKLKLLIDSVTSFSYLPIRVMSYLGFTVALVGFLYAGAVVFNYLAGNPTHGWSSLMMAVLVIGGIQMLMMGVLGEYLWRALDESRDRPRYLIEATTDSQSDALRSYNQKV